MALLPEPLERLRLALHDLARGLLLGRAADGIDEHELASLGAGALAVGTGQRTATPDGGRGGGNRIETHRQRCQAGEQQVFHDAVSFGAGRGGFGRGGWAWIIARAAGISPSISRSLASKDLSIARSISLRCSASGFFST